MSHACRCKEKDTYNAKATMLMAMHTRPRTAETLSTVSRRKVVAGVATGDGRDHLHDALDALDHADGFVRARKDVHIAREHLLKDDASTKINKNQAC